MERQGEPSQKCWDRLVLRIVTDSLKTGAGCETGLPQGAVPRPSQMLGVCKRLDMADALTGAKEEERQDSWILSQRQERGERRKRKGTRPLKSHTIDVKKTAQRRMATETIPQPAQQSTLPQPALQRALPQPRTEGPCG